jgi:hypothetical protein
MASVMIICPKTGKYVSVGMSMDAASFKTCSFVDNAVTCPACGDTHRWSSEDARLLEEIPDKVEP